MEQSRAADEAPVYSSEIEMESQKGRRSLDSRPRYYYPTIDEMVRFDTEEVNRHLCNIRPEVHIDGKQR